jgi:hypothetical protein
VLDEPDAKIVGSVAWWLKDFSGIPVIPSERWRHFYQKGDDPSSFNYFVGTRGENIRNAMPVIFENINLFVGGYDPFSSMSYENIDAQKLMVPEFLKLAQSANPKAREMAYEELCSCSEVLAGYTDQLAKLLEKENDKDCLDSLIWAIANVGQPAAGMVPIMEKKMLDESLRKYCIFALSRISPDKEKRLSYVNNLIKMVKDESNDKSKYVRMLGLVGEFEDLIQPELAALLFEDEGRCSYTHDQAIYALARKKPYTTLAVETIGKVLDRNINLPPGETESCLSAVFCCLEEFPEDGVKFLPLLKKMNFREQRDTDIRYRIVLLTRQEKK